MKKQLLCILFSFFLLDAYSQSNPVALKPGISIQRLLTIKNGAIRMERDEIDNQLYYVLTGGDIYKVMQPIGLPAYDTLVYTVANHGVQYVQGFTFHDSTWYVCGNQNSNSPLTQGIIVRGKLQPNGTRMWDTLMHTANYETNGAFDHLFAGVAVSPAGDSIYISSGARGDHGEIETNSGLYPGMRNTPMTSNLFAFPTHDSLTITIQDDSMWLDTSGYLYARGVRNHFDLAFDQGGNLFGLENSGDRDHNEELNWLRPGRHYGFPWVMGNTENPQQYSWFDPFADSLINHNSRSWRFGAWTNDTLFPQVPPGLTFELPVPNYGPDCDKYRDSLDVVHDASDEGIPIYSFTAHRSPLGLVFDNQNILGPLYEGDAFMFSWTEGWDSTGSPPPPDSTHIGPFEDPSQDMVHLDISYDIAQGNFRMNATRVIKDFKNPVDAEIDSNRVYMIENGYGNTSGLFVITMPVDSMPCAPSVAILNPDTCTPDSNTVIMPSFGIYPNTVAWYDNTGNVLKIDSGLTQQDSISMLPTGSYYVVITDGGACPVDTVNFVINNELQLIIDSVHHTTCIGCNNGEVFYHGMYGTPPYQTNLPTINLVPGAYTLCITDGLGCMVCDTFMVLDDPTGVDNINLDNAVSLFPNPAQDYLYLKSKSEITGIKIYNTEGKSLVPKVIESPVDIRSLSAGTYTVEIQTTSGAYIKMLTILRN